MDIKLAFRQTKEWEEKGKNALTAVKIRFLTANARIVALMKDSDRL